MIEGLGRLARLGGVYIAIAAIQRAIWLLRADPFGHPLVDRFEWYFFHAVAYDLLQGAWLLLPGLGVLLLWSLGGRSKTSGQQFAIPLSRILLACILAMAAMDQEVMRFMGIHLSPWYLATYVTPEGLQNTPAMLLDDQGGPFAGSLLMLLSPAAFWWLSGRSMRRERDETRRVRALRPVVLLLIGVFLSHAWTAWIWKGSFRAWRLRPPIELIVAAVKSTTAAPLDASIRQRAAADHRARWRRMNEATDTPAHRRQHFVLADRPLWHETGWRLCNRDPAAALAAGVSCTTDHDGDGVALGQDCDDSDPKIHRGATDLPANGVDEDCSGIDAQPPNVLLLIMESHRSMNCGHVRPDSGQLTSTPRLDELAEAGVAFCRASANGLPTIASFMTLHTGLLPRAPGHVAVDHAGLELDSLPARLRAAGYYTCFATAAEPAWDNQSAWLARWYDDVDYDRGRIEDGPLFDHLADGLPKLVDKMTDAQGKRRPFLLTVMTRTNHFPFGRVDGVQHTGPDTMAARMHDTMRYADAAMARLLDALASHPELSNTIVVVTGDHGFPLGEHGVTRLYEGAHVESLGVPLVFWGDHPELKTLRRRGHNELASHIDVVPTVLDLLGMDASGPWMGRSLVGHGRGEVVALTDSHASVERGRHRVLQRRWREPATGRLLVYDRSVDPLERAPLALDQHTELVTAADSELADLRAWMTWLYRSGRAEKPN